MSPKTFAPKLVILDFSDMDSMEDVVSEVVDCCGCVDVLICNSSMKLKAPVQNVTLEVDRNIMDINYFGPSTLAKGGRLDTEKIGYHYCLCDLSDPFFKNLNAYTSKICGRCSSNNDGKKIGPHCADQQHPGKTGCPVQKFM